MKTVVLKPIMWNSKAYRIPSGMPSSGGFAKEFGYGHEEWNNNRKWIWHGYRVFHTEAQDALLRYSETGELGIVMIASHDAQQFAVGVATNVFHNTDVDRRLIAEELALYENWKDIWSLQIVQDRFGHDQRKFLNHWKKNYTWVRWKAPKDNYLWFKQPVKLDAASLAGRKKVVSMHSRYQAITPRDAIRVVLASHAPKNHPCLRWLRSGDFDRPLFKDTSKRSGSPTAAGHVATTSAAPTSFSYQYWVEGKRSVEPLHARLQARFVTELRRRGVDPKENFGRVDVQYTRNGKNTLCEIKPTDNVPTRYAIRFAVGQLLEYRHELDPAADLEMVLGKAPSSKERDFVESLGIRLSYWSESSKSFRTTW